MGLTARSTTLKTINMKFMIIVMLAVGAMAVSKLKEPELGNYLVVGTVESNPAAFMRYGYGPAPSAGAYPNPGSYHDYPTYHSAPTGDKYHAPAGYSHEFAYQKNYPYTPYEYQRAAFEGPSAYAPAAYPSVHQLNPFAAFVAKKQ